MDFTIMIQQKEKKNNWKTTSQKLLKRKLKEENRKKQAHKRLGAEKGHELQYIHRATKQDV